MDRQAGDEILQDAFLLAQYALRSGRLPPDCTIFSLIHEIRQRRDRAAGDPADAASAGADEAALYARLFADIDRVACATGVTIGQLRQRKTPLGWLRLRTLRVTPYLLGFLTLLLTLYLAFQSSELHKADLALREYQDLVNERLPEKIYLAWKLFYYQRAISANVPEERQLDDYQKLVEEAQRLSEKRSAVRKLLVDASVTRYMPALFQYNGPCWLQHFAAAMNSATPGTGVARHCLQTPPADTLQEAPAEPGCPKAAEAPAAPPGKPLPPIRHPTDVDDFSNSLACFVHSLRLTADHDAPVSPQIYATRDKANLLVSWFLPGLYGLLGACVFLMRDLLRVNGQHGPQGDKRIVDLLSLLLRIALGGLAGIIIGWFWVPTSAGSSASPIPVSSVSFGLAFLAGFSIDMLFSLLDRVNKTIGQDGDRPDAEAAAAKSKAQAPA